MSSTFGGIEIGKRALQTQQKSLDVVGHNIANANNENYSRQRAVQTATNPYSYPSINDSTSAGQVGTGVEVDEIQRVRDRFIDHRIRSENYTLGEWSVKKENLKEIESIFNDLDSSGFTKTLNDFFDSFDNLNNNPEDIAAARTDVVETASTLTTQLTQIDRGLRENLGYLGYEISGKIDKVNTLTTKIADLNKQIKAVESNSKKNANDLLDERDGLIEKLSGLVDIKVTTNEFNQADVTLNGIKLVQAHNSNDITVSTEDYKPTVEVDSDDDLTDDDTYQYDFKRYTFEVNGNSVPIESGEIKGLMDVRERIFDYKMNVDEMARRLKNEVNNLHADGTDYNGNSAGDAGFEEDFFQFVPADDYDSSHLVVNQNIYDDPTKIAASENGDVGDGSVAHDIFRLKDKSGTIGSTTFNDFWESNASQLGLEISRAERMEQNQQVVVDELKQKREEISGVSLDEEMSEMVKYQHGYNAAAKVVSTMDEMLSTLINDVKR